MMVRLLLMFSILFTTLVYAQQEYFTPENKKLGLEYYKKQIYRSCYDPKDQQNSVSSEEMKRLVSEAQKIVEENFSRAFDENPEVKTAFQEDLNEIVKDRQCQWIGNHCRVRLLSLAIYYYKQFRADLSDCKTIQTPHCKSEEKYRKSTLVGVQGSNYGMPGPAMYKKQLAVQKSDVTIELYNKILKKDKNNLHICNPAENGLGYHYTLDLEEPGSYYTGLDPKYDPRSSLTKECVEEKEVLFSELVPTSFDEGRSTVGQDEVEPIRLKISTFLRSDPNLIVTDVTVTASASKTPFYTTVAGKKVIDPQSAQKNLDLVKERAVFVEKVLSDLKAANSNYSLIKFESKAELAGPDFTAIDLNERFVTRMSSGYLEKIDSLYKRYKPLFEEQALTKSAEDLLNEKKYANLYQAKYKPFQGLRIIVRGLKKENMKCMDPSRDFGKEYKTSTSRQ